MRHYRRLVFYTFKRFEGDHYTRMREYLAEVFLDEIEAFVPLANRRILDVGGANGEFCRVLEARRPSCRAINLDLLPDRSSPLWKRTAMGSGIAMPFPDQSFDVVLCRGVIEHLPPPGKARLLTDIRRALRHDGLGYIMTQPWWNPNAGHHLKPFHVLPFPLAKRLRHLVFGNRVEGTSYADEQLYPNTFRDMMRLIQQSGLRYITGLDTHLRMHFMTSIPLLREVAIPSVAYICRRA